LKVLDELWSFVLKKTRKRPCVSGSAKSSPSPLGIVARRLGGSYGSAFPQLIAGRIDIRISGRRTKLYSGNAAHALRQRAWIDRAR
jgi:hypothetical protein